MNELPVDPQLKTKSVDDTPKRSRVGLVWITLAAFVLILILLLIFILENSQTVHFKYLGAHANIGFGVAMLLAAVVGAVLTLLIGSVRIIQLKFATRHQDSKTPNQLK
jgi:putative membrane protein